MDSLVSVILPVYNAIKYLETCLEALVKQNYKYLEIIAINDGSTDGSEVLLEAYAKKYINLFKIIHTKNNGVWRARNIGISHAQGKYIAFCDSDDIPLPDIYSKLVVLANNVSADITICPYYRIDIITKKILSIEMNQFNNDIYNLKNDPGILPIINTALWNKLFRASVLKEVIHLAEPPRVLEDMMFLCSIYPKCSKIAFIDSPQYKYMTRVGSAMNQVSIDEMDAIVNAMIQTKEHVIKYTEDIRYLEICDLIAFIHLGISFPLRLSRSNERLFKSINKTIRLILEQKFPLYKKNQFCTIRYNLTHKNKTIKIMFVLFFYKFHLINLFLLCYNFISDVLRIEIKW